MSDDGSVDDIPATIVDDSASSSGSDIADLAPLPAAMANKNDQLSSTSPPSETATGDSSDRTTPAVIALVVIGGIGAGVVALIFVMRSRRQSTGGMAYKAAKSTRQQRVQSTTHVLSRASSETASSLALEHLECDDEHILSNRIPFEKLEFCALLSRGGYGEVYHGTYRGQLVAIKTLLPEHRKSSRQIHNFMQEVKLLCSLEHQRIVQFIGVAWDSLNELSVVLEFMENGDLRTLLHRYEYGGTEPRGFNAVKIKIALQVAHALMYLHSLDPCVLHRDLKSRNILLDADLSAMVTDFGVSRERANSTMTAGVGSSLWMAPEVMMGERYDEKADIFSFGVVLSELDKHALPYTDAVEPETGRRLPETAILQMVTIGLLSVGFSEDAAYPAVAQLGRDCVALDPAARPSVQDVLHRLHLVHQTIEYKL